MASAIAGKSSSPAAVAVAWIIVVVPLLWGFSFTVQNAMKLFQTAPPAAAAPVTSGVAPAAK